MRDAATPAALFHVPRPLPDAPLRLVCVPYAGGGAGVFRGWHTGLPGIEVAAVRLPGRESRYTDPPYRTMGPLVADLADAITATADRPYALFGHSMGARVAFETARRLRRVGGPQPRCLFVSGCRAPHLPLRPPTGHLTDARFVQELRALGGAPPQFFADPELVALLLPMLRADFGVLESYEHAPAAPLGLPVRAFCGDADPHVSPAQAAAWRAHTTSRFGLTRVAGGHFYLAERRDTLLRTIREELARSDSPPKEGR
ncbi:alpha/beta fold hydrolase [Streptomyces castrisilvae]|uniref:Alpha/beta fold hydrolase n=1 Tax=Streptomyces castrisilvae TaxID=3033811 RepID=A0ABY9HCN6_9ACTN|nr:alpha/beta fold hydrolase [Streptomyces sp. Mut1]WLQ32272.1 alpha/beta fold hydrolase [Streptomyces sp. Mut1]